MRAILVIFILILGCKSLATAQAYPHSQSAHLTHADVDFFFNSIVFKDGICEFKLSPNTIGMSWRIRTDKLDNTGGCQSGQS
jgi:hypothetical protein